MYLPLTTPFYPDGRLNVRKLAQNVARYSLTPVAGIVVLGASGEANLLSDVETREALKMALEAASETKVMLAGVSRDGVAATLELIDYAAELGYDAAVVRAPSFAGVSAKETHGYLLTVADRSALPVVLAGELPVELVAELAGHPRVLGLVSDFARPKEIKLLVEKTAAVKRSVTVTQVFTAVTGRMRVSDTPEGALVSAESLTGGVAVLAAVASKPAVKTRTKVVGFQILAAGTERMLEGLAAGAVGVVPAFSASAPQACYEVVAAWKDGDPGLAEEKQLRLVEVVRRVEGELGVAGIKYGCDLNGYFGGTPRLPLLPVTGEQRVEIEALMQGLRS